MRAGAIALVFCLVQQSIASTVPRGLDGDGHYNLTFLHTNDVHARLDQFEASGAPCESDHECVGGYARLKSKIDELRRQNPDTVVLNAGDEWQGTMFFTYYNDGRTIADTLNTVGFDAMVLGNHEFDEGEDKLAAYLKMLHFPVLGANVHTTSPSLKAANVLPYTIISKHSLAVIGLTTTETPQVSSPSQRTTFSSPATALSEQVKAIKAAHPEVKRFVALTHLGYGEDIALAKASRDVHLFIGGHSHTLLGDMDKARGKYPTVVKNAANQDVLVVTSYRYGEYLGRLSVLFNRDGQIDKWEGAPILMSDDIRPDAVLDQKVAEWRKPFLRFSQEIVGHIAVTSLSNVCGRKECSLGNLVCDVIVAYRNSGGETAQVDGAIYNAGGIRTPLPKGAVSRRDVMNAFPFANAVVEMSLTGQELWNVFSSMLNKVNMAGHAIHSYLQVSSHFEIRFDPTRPVGERLLSLAIGGNPVILHKTYSIATNDFIAAGGDFFFPKTQRDASVPAGPKLASVDELVIKYLKKHDPYAPPLVGRRLRDVTKPADLDIESNAQLLAVYDGTGYPVEDGAWTAVAIMAASITFIVLAVEYLRRDSLL